MPYHNQMQSDGLVDALFLVNPESCQGIGIAIFEEAKKLRELEKGTSREMARAIRDPVQAPTPYTRDRARYIEELAGGITSTVICICQPISHWPRIMPMPPTNKPLSAPSTAIIAASERNCAITWRGNAPTARRRPISACRSRTDNKLTASKPMHANVIVLDAE